jgi:2-polyprenyl-6-methoxyphenol hydroxylase-like FAD-dependent oxidoreductase
MTSIGIVGSGIAGLHLGLFLRQHGISATIYADRTPDEQP